jgi:hypothetical protein
MEDTNRPKNRLDNSSALICKRDFVEPVLNAYAQTMGRPRIRQTFAIFDPKMFPTAIPASPSNVANRDTTASGNEVETDTTMNPSVV